MSRGRSTNFNEDNRRREQVVPKVYIAVKSQDGRESYYRCMAEKKLQPLFSKYCEENNLEYESVSFLHRGQRINPKRTPTELGLMNGDVINAATGYPSIMLWFKAQDGTKICYEGRRDKMIRSLLSKYCMDKDLEYKAVAFLIDGVIIKASKTPDELGLEENDEIDALVHHIGGA